MDRMMDKLYGRPLYIRNIGKVSPAKLSNFTVLLIWIVSHGMKENCLSKDLLSGFRAMAPLFLYVEASIVQWWDTFVLPS